MRIIENPHKQKVPPQGSTSDRYFENLVAAQGHALSQNKPQWLQNILSQKEAIEARKSLTYVELHAQKALETKRSFVENYNREQQQSALRRA